jgi:3-deoxy-7-phosphoheptulonate synthase/chorismate mutase
MRAEYQPKDPKKSLLVSRESKSHPFPFRIKDVTIGDGNPVIIAGPCSIENKDQMDDIAKFLSQSGAHIFRGGSFKPRTSPYSFQGLREDGLTLLREIAKRYNLITITEVPDANYVDLVYQYTDIFQIGSRNMQNFELLKAVGATDKHVLLKRGFMSTLEEFLLAAEHIASKGNEKIILCERGIRTFEKWTRNTLDISAIPILKKTTHLPVIVDISHSTGRRDIAIPMAKASLAAGADGLMIEVHNNPDAALSDSEQQLPFDQFSELMQGIKPFLSQVGES